MNIYQGFCPPVYAPELTREAIFESLRSRRVYATSQPHRILVRFAVDGTAVGDVVDDDPVTGMRWDDERGSRADVYYLRVEQADDGMAWAGPLWAEPAE